MFSLFKRSGRKQILDRRVLEKNDISLVILDERWNNLFINNQKTADIVSCEEKIKELLKEQSRLTNESKEIATVKKRCMEKIMGLTTEAFEKNNEDARAEMDLCHKEIKRINERQTRIELELDRIPDLLAEANLKLLDRTVRLVYYKIRSGQKRVKELEILIEETRSRLKDYIDEKETLAQGDSDTYMYFHDLLGAEELERLDREFFGE